MKTVLHHKTCHSQSLNKARYDRKTGMSSANKWKETGYSIGRKSVCIEKSNPHYIRFKNHRNIAYSLLAIGIETNNPSYGIYVSQNGRLVDYALNLSKNYEEVKSLVVLCNKEDLHLVHFRDVLEDFFWIKQEEANLLISKDTPA